MQNQKSFFICKIIDPNENKDVCGIKKSLPLPHSISQSAYNDLNSQYISSEIRS